MRFEQVRATAFGPLKGKKLDLAEGMNVVHGRNEAGKSSWFAALYAGLVGRRTARGAGTLAQREFRRRHKPWVGSQWVAGVSLILDDGREIDIDHDLVAGSTVLRDGQTERIITDASLARNLGIELTTDGGVDGARLVGLTRDAARSTMFVGQADIVGVLHHSGELQEHLQRAAASSKLDTTAEQAIARVSEQRRDRVGSPHVGNRPLRAFSSEVEQARARLGDAIDARHAYQEMLVHRAELAEEVERDTLDFATVTALENWQDVDRLNARITAARALQERIAELEARGLPAPTSHIDRVVGIVEAYRALDAQPMELDGKSLLDLQEELEALPAEPTGPLQPEQVVVDALRALSDAEASLATLSVSPETEPADADTTESAEELRTFAHQLELTHPALPDAVRQNALESRQAFAEAQVEYQALAEAHESAMQTFRQDQATYATDVAAYQIAEERFRDDFAAYEVERRSLEIAKTEDETSRRSHAELIASQRGQRSRARALRIGGIAAAGCAAVLLAAGVIALVAGLLIPVGIPALALAIAFTAAAIVLLTRRAGPADVPDWAPRRLPVLRAQPVPPSPPAPPAPFATPAPGPAPEAPTHLLEAERQLSRWEEDERNHRDKLSRAHSLVAQLGLPADAEALRRLARSLDDRDAAQIRREQHKNAVAGGRVRVQNAAAALLHLLTPGVQVTPDTNLSAAARSAFDLYSHECDARREQARLAGRREDLKAAVEQRTQQEAALRASAERRDVVAAELSHSAQQLTGLQDGSNPDEALRALDDWLREQRDRSTMGDERIETMGRLDQLLDGEEIGALEIAVFAKSAAAGERPDESLWGNLTRAEVEAQLLASTTALAELDGRLTATKRTLTSIGEAVEAETRATDSLERVRALDRVYDLAERHLGIAKERAHADIAPALAATIRPWVPRITSGNFTDIEIDAEELMVRASAPGRKSQDADVLSHGTMEQLFLLLRIALVEHLSSSDEVAPLVLDDVTVQSDSARTVAILELLKELSTGRQIILFTQEAEVVEWAHENLAAPNVVAL